MLEVGLGVSASVFFSLTYIFSRLATRELSPLLGGLIVSATITLSFLPWVVFTVPATEFRNPSLLWFVGLGVFLPGFARTLHIAGIKRIGAAPVALLRGLGPLFAGGLAVFLLGERFTAPVAAGTGFIVLGLVVLSVQKGEMRSWAPSGVAYALAATLILVFRDIIIRYAAPHAPYKTLSIFVMALTSTVLMAGAWRYSGRKWPGAGERRGLIYFILVGLAGVFGLVSLFSALELGDVVVITPLVSAQPLFVMLFSWFLPEGMERITPRMIAGGALIVLGGALVGLR